MTTLTILTFQNAYPDFIRFEKEQTKDGLLVECWLLNEDKEPHTILFSGKLKNESEIETLCNQIMEIEL